VGINGICNRKLTFARRRYESMQMRCSEKIGHLPPVLKKSYAITKTKGHSLPSFTFLYVIQKGKKMGRGGEKKKSKDQTAFAL
jgi:hypothetical protein